MSRLLTLLRRRGGGGAPPPLTPTNWWDALDGASFDVDVGDLVGSWTDRVGGVAATAAGPARPTRGTDRLTFSGAQVLTALVGTRPLPESLYVVAMRTGGSTGPAFIEQAATVLILYGYAVDHPTPSLRNRVGIFNGVELLTTFGVAAPLEARAVFVAVFNGASSSVRYNNVVDVTGNAGTSTGSGLSIGGPGGTSLTGTISAVLRYANTAHNATQRAAMVAWLAGYYGVTL